MNAWSRAMTDLTVDKSLVVGNPEDRSSDIIKSLRDGNMKLLPAWRLLRFIETEFLKNGDEKSLRPNSDIVQIMRKGGSTSETAIRLLGIHLAHLRVTLKVTPLPGAVRNAVSKMRRDTTSSEGDAALYDVGDEMPSTRLQDVTSGVTSTPPPPPTPILVVVGGASTNTTKERKISKEETLPVGDVPGDNEIAFSFGVIHLTRKQLSDLCSFFKSIDVLAEVAGLALWMEEKEIPTERRPTVLANLLAKKNQEAFERLTLAREARPKAETAAPTPQRSTGQWREPTRLPEDWQPTREQIAMSEFNLGNVGGKWAVQRFKIHWLEQTSTDAMKVDWEQEFKLWVYKAYDSLDLEMRANLELWRTSLTKW